MSPPMRYCETQDGRMGGTTEAGDRFEYPPTHAAARGHGLDARGVDLIEILKVKDRPSGQVSVSPSVTPWLVLVEG